MVMKSYNLRIILSSTRNTDQKYSLIDDKDVIAIGISGGKDSLGLFYSLNLYKKFSGKNFDIIPILLDLGFDNRDFSSLSDFFSSLGYELKIIDSRFVYPALQAHTKEGKHLSCSLCSRMKKAAIKDAAISLGANKIAFAHHKDDMLETLLLNVLKSQKLATFSPKMIWEDAKITFIRPLFDVDERNLRGLAEELNFPIFDLGCPANHHTEREEMKNLLSSLNKKYPDAKKNISASLINYESMDLPASYLEGTCAIYHEYSLKNVVTVDDIRNSTFANKKKRDGEVDFLILKNHQKVGEISYSIVRNHNVYIYNLLGEKDAQISAINEIIRVLSKKIIPCTFVLQNVKKNVAEESGFIKKQEFGIKGMHYIKKIKYS